MTAVLYWWRTARRQTWRSTLGAAIVVGLLAAAALGALAGARRTGSAYSRYLRSINSSDVIVNTPTADLDRVRRIAALPEVKMSRSYAGLDAQPVVRGTEDDNFLTNGVDGSLDGFYFTQDAMTLLQGRFPRLDSTDEIALTRGVAKLFGVGVGGRVTYNFYTPDPVTQTNKPAGSATYTVTAIVSVPPVLVDEVQIAEKSVLPPAATKARVASTGYLFHGLQLKRGALDIPALQRDLAKLSAADHEPANLDRLQIVHAHVQDAIRPQSVALGLFGLAAALALLIIGAQLATRAVSRAAVDRGVLRGMGASRSQLTVASSLDAAVSLALGLGLGIVGAIAASPLAPIGSVRPYDPARGLSVDLTVLFGGGALLLLLLWATLLAISWREVARPSRSQAARPSGLAAAAGAAGLGVPAVLGARMAVEPGRGRTAVPVRSTIVGSIAAVVAVAAATVFGASLRHLVHDPQRYGWAWDVMVVDQGGYGNLAVKDPNFTGAIGDLEGVRALMRSQPGVAGWSLVGYTGATINGLQVPTVGLDREEGGVEPPTSSGHSVAAPDQIELGAVTLRQLHKHVGDVVEFRVGVGARQLKIVGTATFASVGVNGADHPSLGTGGLVDEAMLLATSQPPGTNCSHGGGVGFDAAFTECPSTILIDLKRGTDPRVFASKLVGANPDPETPGGAFQQVRVRGAQIVSSAQMANEPLVLALLLALGAVASLALTQLSSVRQRRRDLALLKALGMTRRQLRSVVAWNATLSTGIAVLLGLPLGIAGGRIVWLRFANGLGVVPTPSVPLALLVAGAVGLLVLANLAAAVPGSVAARTPAARILRSE
ncbi:MAG: FtsX-like permease family protein [Acidimicrobiales bacterium]